MLEAGLAIDFHEIRAQVADYLFGTREGNFSKLQLERIESCIRSGLRKAYYPASVDPAMHHDWSFLTPTLVLKIDSGSANYELPADFGGFCGDSLSHESSSDSNAWPPVLKTTPDDILARRSHNTTASGYPMFFAERPKSNGGLSGQRWEVMIFPDPDSTYILAGQHRINPHALTSYQKYPYGGPEFSQTILEACLSEAELLDGQPGAHKQEFLTCLRASIEIDRRAHRGRWLGNNGKTRGAIPDWYRFENLTPRTWDT